MTRKGSVIVTEPDRKAAGVTLTPCPPEALMRLELWGDANAVAARAQALGLGVPPPVGRAVDNTGGRWIWIEPAVWLVRAPLAQLAEVLARLETVAGEDGAAFDITGGLARFRLTGPRWRELLTIGAVFDVENPEFAPGCAAATILQHAAVWFDVIDDGTCDVYCLPSYAQDLADGWARAIARMAD